MDYKQAEVYKDYKKYKYIPTIDALLDYRNSLMQHKDNPEIKVFIMREIEAVDHLINLKQGKWEK